MWYLLDENDKSIQKQVNEPEDTTGWIFVEVDVAPGMVWTGIEFVMPDKTLVEKKDILKNALGVIFTGVLSSGVDWRAANPDDWNNIPYSEETERFLNVNTALLNEGRVLPHGGFFDPRGGVKFSIDDGGLRELATFMGCWYFKVSQTYLTIGEEIDALSDLTIDAYDLQIVDWSVNWIGDDAANGWTDNTVTQAP